VREHNYGRKDRDKGKEVAKQEEEGSYDLHFVWGFLLHLLLLFLSNLLIEVKLKMPTLLLAISSL